MSHPRSISVLKFGSSVLSDLSKIGSVVEEIYRHRRSGHKVLAVVSAIGNSTDILIKEAKLAKKEPTATALALLLATGETRSVALVTLACQESGIAATPIPAHEIGILTDGDRLNARPIHVDTRSILRQFEDYDVLVVPGFIGLDIFGKTSLLGRGGSDLTAVYLAKAVDAKTCCLLKDTAGVFECDPRTPGRSPRRYDNLSFDDALKIDGEVLQSQAVEHAKKYGQTFEVRSAGGVGGTTITPGPSNYHDGSVTSSPVRVSLLGCGQVGSAVLGRIEQHTGALSLIGIAVRNKDKHQHQLPTKLLTEDAQTLASMDQEIVIELIGGVKVALPAIREALLNGKHVVTANKELIALHGAELKRLAKSKALEFLYSAAVGGSVPVIETVQQRLDDGKVIHSIVGILNGTSNFILDQLELGKDLQSALKLAQENGLCEANADNDLNGSDAARKLIVLAGVVQPNGPILEVKTTGTIDNQTARKCILAKTQGQHLRQIARLSFTGGQVKASVSLEPLPKSSFLGQTDGAENRVVITYDDESSERLRGLGAGPSPTAEAVLADILQIGRRQVAVRKPHARREVNQ